MSNHRINHNFNEEIFTFDKPIFKHFSGAPGAKISAMNPSSGTSSQMQ